MLAEKTKFSDWADDFRRPQGRHSGNARGEASNLRLSCAYDRAMLAEKLKLSDQISLDPVAGGNAHGEAGISGVRDGSRPLSLIPVILGARHQHSTGKGDTRMRLDRTKVNLSGRTPTNRGTVPDLWRQFADGLIRQIETGALEPGHQVFISYQAKVWSCTPRTAAKAFDHLAYRGYLQRPRARGHAHRVSDEASWMRNSG